MTSSDEEVPSTSPEQDCPMVVRVILVAPLSLIVFSSHDVTSMLVFTCSLIVPPRAPIGSNPVFVPANGNADRAAWLVSTRHRRTDGFKPGSNQGGVGRGNWGRSNRPGPAL